LRQNLQSIPAENKEALSRVILLIKKLFIRVYYGILRQKRLRFYTCFHVLKPSLHVYTPVNEKMHVFTPELWRFACLIFQRDLSFIFALLVRKR